MTRPASDTPQLVALIRQWMETFTLRSMKDERSYVRESGLSMPQHFLLMHLYRRGDFGVREVSRRLEITSAAASQLIDRLVKAGLAQRAEDPADRRARKITLTAKGRALMEKSLEERYRWVQGLARGLSPAERDAVFKVLPILIAAEKRLAEEPGRLGPASPKPASPKPASPP